MAVPESMTVFDISGQYTMVRGLILVTFGRYYLRGHYLWPMEVYTKSKIIRWTPSLTLMSRVT